MMEASTLINGINFDTSDVVKACWIGSSVLLIYNLLKDFLKLVWQHHCICRAVLTQNSMSFILSYSVDCAVDSYKIILFATY